MEIRDEDMQMIRVALTVAPEYVKGHFENLLTQYEAAVSEIEELEQQVEKANSECDELRCFSIDPSELRERDEVLEAVKYWFHDGMKLRDAQKIQRMVEEICR